MYFSSLINNVIRPIDSLELNFDSSLKLPNIGTRLPHGRLIAHGSLGDDVAHQAEGGVIIVYGDVGDSAASYMNLTRLMIVGSAGSSFAYRMRGGQGRVVGHAGPNLANHISGGAVRVESTDTSLEELMTRSGGSRIYVGSSVIPTGKMPPSVWETTTPSAASE